MGQSRSVKRGAAVSRCLGGRSVSPALQRAEVLALAPGGSRGREIRGARGAGLQKEGFSPAISLPAESWLPDPHRRAYWKEGLDSTLQGFKNWGFVLGRGRTRQCCRGSTGGRSEGVSGEYLPRTLSLECKAASAQPASWGFADVKLGHTYAYAHMPRCPRNQASSTERGVPTGMRPWNKIQSTARTGGARKCCVKKGRPRRGGEAS